MDDRGVTLCAFCDLPFSKQKDGSHQCPNGHHLQFRAWQDLQLKAMPTECKPMTGEGAAMLWVKGRSTD